MVLDSQHVDREAREDGDDREADGQVELDVGHAEAPSPLFDGIESACHCVRRPPSPAAAPEVGL